MMKKLYIISFYSIPVIIAILLVVRIVETNALASFGEKVQGIDRRITVLAQENELLVTQVASASSLITIASRAHQLGFVQPSKNQVITIARDQFPVALK